MLPKGSDEWDAVRWHGWHRKQAKAIGCEYDEDKANDVVSFFSLLKHVKGKWGGEDFTLLPWQEHEVIRPFFGYLVNGKRRYKRCFIAIAKKNGKTSLCAGLALWGLFGEKEPGAEVYSAAADREQASLIFQQAGPMVRHNDVLSEVSKVLEVQRRIVYPSVDGFYQVLSAEVETKHGLNPSMVIFDELHAQPNRYLWDVLTQGAFAAREQPALFVITTAGYDRNSICFEEWEWARRVRDGQAEDPTLLSVIYELAEDADWTDPKLWPQANPSLGVTITEDDMASECAKAQELPSNESAFRRLRCNQWVSSEMRFIPMDRWDACKEEPHPFGIHFGGLDLSSTTDISAYVRVCLDGDDLDVKGHYWLPAEGIEAREKRDRAPYRLWEKQGWMTLTPGNVIDYESIRDYINRCSDESGKPKEIGFDPWNATQLCEIDLPGDGHLMVPVRQGYVTLSAPTKRLLALALSGHIRHGDDPVLRWMADNVMVTTDPAGNIKPDKAKSRQRIDGIVALIIALDRASRHGNEPPVEVGIRYL